LTIGIALALAGPGCEWLDFGEDMMSEGDVPVEWYNEYEDPFAYYDIFGAEPEDVEEPEEPEEQPAARLPDKTVPPGLPGLYECSQRVEVSVSVEWSSDLAWEEQAMAVVEAGEIPGTVDMGQAKGNYLPGSVWLAGCHLTFATEGPLLLLDGEHVCSSGGELSLYVSWADGILAQVDGYMAGTVTGLDYYDGEVSEVRLELECLRLEELDR